MPVGFIKVQPFTLSNKQLQEDKAETDMKK